MPQQPAPPVQYPPQERPAPIKTGNPWNVNYDNQTSNNSDSTSEATNVVSQSGSLTNIQNNFGQLNYVQIGQVRLPSEWSFNNATSYTSNGDFITTVGVQFTPQGKSKKYAHRYLEMQSLEQQAAVCAKLMKSGIMINSEINPNYAFCDGFALIPPAPPAPKVSQAALEAQLRIKELELKLEAMTQRLEQLQKTPSSNKVSG